MGLVEYFGTLGMILAFCLGASPIPSLYQGYKDMEINNITIIYLLSAVSNCSLWTLYGIKQKDTYICFTNGVLLLLFLLYLFIFLYIKKERYIKIAVIFYIISSADSMIYAFIPANIIGFAAFLVNSIWSLCAIETLRDCLKSKDPKLINIQISWVSTLCSLSWLFYGILSENIFVLIPNFIGTVLWAANITCYYWSNEKMSHDSFVVLMMKKIFLYGQTDIQSNSKDVMKEIMNEPKYDKTRLLNDFRTTGRSFDKNNF